MPDDYFFYRAPSFNAGVFVTDLSAWDRLGITSQLLTWLVLNGQEPVYGTGPAGGGSQPPMMIVFHNKFALIDPVWHLRGFGGIQNRTFVFPTLVSRGAVAVL